MLSARKALLLSHSQLRQPQLISSTRALSAIKGHQIRYKSEAFPIPPSFKLSKAARAGRHPNKQRPQRWVNQTAVVSLAPRNRPEPSARPGRGVGSSGGAFGNPSANALDTQDNSRIVLQNDTENIVNMRVGRTMGMSTEHKVQQFCGDRTNPNFYEFLPAYIGRDQLRSDTIKHFWEAARPFLPNDPVNSVVRSPKGKLHRSQYSKLPTTKENELLINRISLHSHLLLFQPQLNLDHILPDGTTRRFLPGPPEIWRYRLWSGGSITMNTTWPPSYDSPNTFHVVERPMNLSIQGSRTPEKAFVTVRKSICMIEGRRGFYNPDTVFNQLVKVPTQNSDGRQLSGSTIDENYTLCFLRDPPNFTSKPTRVLKPLTNASFSWELTPTRHLLYCWSALTYNAHRIHFDAEFARTEYGAANLLVHGPLTVWLMLEWVERQLTQHAMDNNLSTFHLQSFNYKNLLPLYIDESMKLCMRPSTHTEPGTLAPKWDVWIEKSLGEDLTTMAFKGEVELTVENSLIDKMESKNERNGWSKRAKGRDQEEDTPKFKSSFFT